MSVYGKRKAIVGHDAFASEPFLDIHYPIGKKGRIENLDSLEDILSYTAECVLKCEMKERSVLLCETLNQDRAVREKETEILFETFQVNSAYLAVSSILAMYATGRTTGMILECGAGQTRMIPVFEGYPIPTCVVEHSFSGHDMATLLAKKITEHEKNRNVGLELNSAYGIYLVESSLIEKAMNFSISALPTEASSEKQTLYTLSDGREVFVDDVMISECRDMYFSPNGVNVQQAESTQMPNGIEQGTEKCLQKIDMDACHIGEAFILTGGVAGCEGFCDRFVTDFEPIVSKYVQRCAQRSFAKSCFSWKNCDVKHPSHMAWHGGSIFASLQTYGSMWISKSHYDEAGPSIVHRRCP